MCPGEWLDMDVPFAKANKSCRESLTNMNIIIIPQKQCIRVIIIIKSCMYSRIQAKLDCLRPSNPIPTQGFFYSMCNHLRHTRGLARGVESHTAVTRLQAIALQFADHPSNLVGSADSSMTLAEHPSPVNRWSPRYASRSSLEPLLVSFPFGSRHAESMYM